MALRARINTVDETENRNVPAGMTHKLAGNQGVQQVQRRAALGDIMNIESKARTGLAVSKPSKNEALYQKLESLCVQKPASKNEIEPMDLMSPEAEEIEDIDKEDEGNPQLVADYVQEIYQYLRQMETTLSIKPDYLEGQQVILPKMRAVLIDWLIGVHLQFRLLPETVYTSVAIFDRYLSKELKSVSRKTLQLVGVASMLVASKYEEIYAPEIQDFVYITDKAYEKREILDMEYHILEVLEYNLGRPLPLHFLRRASKAGGVEAITHTLAKYVMELSLLEYSLMAEDPSKLAAAALALSMRVLDKGLMSMEEVWSPTLVYYTKYTLKDISHLIVKLAKVLLAAPNAKLSAIYQKYSNKKFMKIARIPALEDGVLRQIAEGRL